MTSISCKIFVRAAMNILQEKEVSLFLGIVFRTTLCSSVSHYELAQTRATILFSILLERYYGNEIKVYSWFVPMRLIRNISFGDIRARIYVIAPISKRLKLKELWNMFYSIKYCMF